MLILAIDPGQTTGLAARFPTGSIYTDQIGPARHHEQLYRQLIELNQQYQLTVVCESFQYRRKLDNANLSPVEYIGVVRLFCSKFKVDLYEQTPAKGKGFWTDDKLKSVGLYRSARPHANDAIRHLLTHITFTLGSHEYLELLKGS